MSNICYVQFIVVTDTVGAVLFNVVYFTVTQRHLCAQNFRPGQIALRGWQIYCIHIIFCPLLTLILCLALNVVCLATPLPEGWGAESNLKLLAKRNRKYVKTVNAGPNDSCLHLSEVTKINVESVCSFAKMISDSLGFSGPLQCVNEPTHCSHLALTYGIENEFNSFPTERHLISCYWSACHNAKHSILDVFYCMSVWQICS